MPPRYIKNELELLATMVEIDNTRIVELGCGAAQLARDLLEHYGRAQVTGIDPDERQLAKNRAHPHERLAFVHGGADASPFGVATFDGALMLKSLHHVPLALMDQSLAEIARVLKPGGWLYVSEPVFAGEFNELVRLFNDEKAVREAAQQAVDRALASRRWQQLHDVRFETPVRFSSFEDFEKRMLHPTFAERQVDDATLQQLRRQYASHADRDGQVNFTRPMHVRLLRRVRTGQAG